MKALYNAIGVLTVLVTGVVCWTQYDAYKQRNDDAYNAQCPNPTHEYFDCEFWPKSGRQVPWDQQ